MDLTALEGLEYLDESDAHLPYESRTKHVFRRLTNAELSAVRRKTATLAQSASIAAEAKAGADPVAFVVDTATLVLTDIRDLTRAGVPLAYPTSAAERKAFVNQYPFKVLDRLVSHVIQHSGITETDLRD